MLLLRRILSPLPFEAPGIPEDFDDATLSSTYLEIASTRRGVTFGVNSTRVPNPRCGMPRLSKTLRREGSMIRSSAAVQATFSSLRTGLDRERE